jgi:hypothetical protein
MSGTCAEPQPPPGDETRRPAQETFRQMTGSREVASISRGTLALKIFQSTFTSDVRIDLVDPRAAYDLEKGQRVTVRFFVRRAGGCILDFTGDQGVIVR